MRLFTGYILVLTAMILTPELQAQRDLYRYTDGNNNVYAIYSFQIVYEPVQPLQSSSGVYSGGKPKIKGITENEFSRLKELLHQGMDAVGEQTDTRPMGSGTIHQKPEEGKEPRLWVLKPDSPIKARIEEYLGELMQ